MKKLIFRAPVQTASGYGVHARMLLRALDQSGLFDITVMSVPWGNTPLIYTDTPENLRIKELARKFNPEQMKPTDFDVSVQVTIPNEFMFLARRNVCITAGIETDRVAQLWHQKTNEVADVLVVPSVHAARGFTTAIFNNQDGSQLMLRKPLYILPEWVNTDFFNTVPAIPKFDFPAAFNFITVGLGMDKAEGEDRKNITQTVKWFCEQFKGSQDVGLVMKVSMVNCSPVDYKNIVNRITYTKQMTGCGQFPRIHLIHGRLGDHELAALYKHPKVKAFLTLTHGEGYGLPIIEAAACGLPVIATNWSGHLDFLQIDGKRKFVPVEYELKPIPESCVWKDVMEAGTRWAVPSEKDAKMKMAKMVLSYDKPKEWAAELALHIAKEYNETLGLEFAEDVNKLAGGQKVKLTKTAKKAAQPSKQVLSNVAIVCVSTDSADNGAHVLRKSCEQIGFGEIILVTSNSHNMLELPAGTRVIELPPGTIKNVQEYDNYVLKELPRHVSSDYILNVQWDGYVLNGSAWDDEFLKYDYIGAPWFWNDVVGNSGFSLRSKKFAEELMKDDYPDAFPQDVNVCQLYRPKLEEKGFKFAPADLARKFSVENEPYVGGFGWHGVNPFNGEKP